MTFDEGVEQAKVLIGSWLASNSQKITQTSLNRNTVEKFEFAPAELIAQSETDPRVFDFLCRWTAISIQRKEPLRPEIRGWLCEYLWGNRPRPSMPSGKPSGGEFDAMIALTVRTLQELGMTASRGEASPPTSAIDAVAMVMKQRRLQPSSYARISKIWFREKKKWVNYS